MRFDKEAKGPGIILLFLPDSFHLPLDVLLLPFLTVGTEIAHKSISFYSLSRKKHQINYIRKAAAGQGPINKKEPRIALPGPSLSPQIDAPRFFTFTEEWNKGDDELCMIAMNRGMQAIIRVIDDVVNLLIDKQMIFPREQPVDDMMGIIQYYLSPLTEYLNNLTIDNRKDLRGYFGTGADTRFWRAYQKAIADKRPDFKPEGLEEYWLNEAKTYNEDTRQYIDEIEKKLKRIISSQLEEGFGSGWLMKGLPKSVYSRINSAADNKIYELTQQGVDTSEVTPWDFISMPDCKEIAIYQKNWSSFFEQLLTRPEDASISGGKEAKTDWIIRINTVKSKLSNKTYSVPFEEFTFVSSVYEWITDVLIM